MSDRCYIQTNRNESLEETIIRSGRKAFKTYEPEFYIGVESLKPTAFYFDDLKEVFDFLNSKYSYLKDHYEPFLCLDEYEDHCRVVCMKSENTSGNAQDVFIAGFVYNY